MARITPFAFAAVAIAVIASAYSPAQPAHTKVLSELPMPKVGEMLSLGKNDVKTQKDDDGLLEVVDMVTEKDKTVTIQSTDWDIDADGWFDKEGFNLTKAYPRSGLWAMRSTKGNKPQSSGSGLPTSPNSLVPQTPPRLYRAGPGDIITHIDGIAVTSYPRYVYAINQAANTRDIPIVVMTGATGRKHLHYITAYKSAGQ